MPVGFATGRKTPSRLNQYAIYETVRFGQNAGDLRPIKWLSANDREHRVKTPVLSPLHILKFVRGRFGPPPECFAEIGSIAEAKSLCDVFNG
jgi:hypothetical protein